VPNDKGEWLTSVIPATKETEIGRITVQGQPRQKVSKTPSQQEMGCACNPGYVGGISRKNML
jgi:hypothetical protein